jgi:hypothetical protein
MTGFIRIADIPKIIVALVAGLLVCGAFAFRVQSFPALRKLAPEWAFMVVILLIFWAALESAEYLWERIRYRRPTVARGGRCRAQPICLMHPISPS